MSMDTYDYGQLVWVDEELMLDEVYKRVCADCDEGFQDETTGCWECPANGNCFDLECPRYSETWQYTDAMKTADVILCNAFGTRRK